MSFPFCKKILMKEHIVHTWINCEENANTVEEETWKIFHNCPSHVFQFDFCSSVIRIKNYSAKRETENEVCWLQISTSRRHRAHSLLHVIREVLSTTGDPQLLTFILEINVPSHNSYGCLLYSLRKMCSFWQKRNLRGTNSHECTWRKLTETQLMPLFHFPVY